MTTPDHSAHLPCVQHVGDSAFTRAHGSPARDFSTGRHSAYEMALGGDLGDALDDRIENPNDLFALEGPDSGDILTLDEPVPVWPTDLRLSLYPGATVEDRAALGAIS